LFHRWQVPPQAAGDQVGSYRPLFELLAFTGLRVREALGRVGVLEGSDLAKVLDRAGSHRALFEVLTYTGLRIGEALGLTWADVDFERSVIRVHRQLSRYREHARLQTEAANREVLLAPAIAQVLRAEWVASAFKSADDFVFTTTTGRGRDYRHVGDAFRLAVTRAGLGGQGRLSLHSLRHGYASLLIGRRLDVVFVSRQLGHANVTLSVYAHLFAQREHGEVARQALEASYTAMREAGRP
jgi:integrase